MNLNLEKVEIRKTELEAFTELYKTIDRFKDDGGFIVVPKILLALNSAFLTENAGLKDDEQYTAGFIADIAFRLDQLFCFLSDLQEEASDINLASSGYNQN